MKPPIILNNSTMTKEQIMLGVNEIFGPTIQGEGKSAGREVLFLRLAGCNLACSYCDTPFAWNWEGTKFVHPDKYDPKKEIHTMSVEQIITELKKLSPEVRALVITGGEPMLQQKQLTEFLEILKVDDKWWVEIETNGTISPTDEFLQLIDQINCSPKMSNSGPDNTLEKREKPEALRKLVQTPKTYFKFVVRNEADVDEVFEMVEKYQMKQVYLMPEGRTRDEQLKWQAQVKRIAENCGFQFSPRLHILRWGTRRAV